MTPSPPQDSPLFPYLNSSGCWLNELTAKPIEQVNF